MQLIIIYKYKCSVFFIINFLIDVYRSIEKSLCNFYRFSLFQVYTCRVYIFRKLSIYLILQPFLIWLTRFKDLLFPQTHPNLSPEILFEKHQHDRSVSHVLCKLTWDPRSSVDILDEINSTGCTGCNRGTRSAPYSKMRNNSEPCSFSRGGERGMQEIDRRGRQGRA